MATGRLHISVFGFMAIGQDHESGFKPIMNGCHIVFGPMADGAIEGKGVEEMRIENVFGSLGFVLGLGLALLLFLVWIVGVPALDLVNDPWGTWTSYEYTIVEVYVTCDEDEVPRVFQQCKGLLMNSGRFIIYARVPNKNNSYIVARFNVDAWCRIEERRIDDGSL